MDVAATDAQRDRQDGTAPAKDIGVQTTPDVRAQMPDAMALPSDVLSPTVDSTLPMVDSTLPMVDGMLPVIDGMIPTVDGTVPMVDGMLPVIDGMLQLVDTGIVPPDSAPPDSAPPDSAPPDSAPPSPDALPAPDAALIADGGGCIPRAEKCDGLDDDCDDLVDEELEGCTRCDLHGATPCNGCPAGTPIPAGFVCAPAGTFTMGSPEDEFGRGLDETPHEVRLTRTILLWATEVTQGEWSAVMRSRPAYFSSCGDDCPVERVSWYDGAVFLNTISANDGLESCYDLRNCGGTPGTGCAPGATTCTGEFTCDPIDTRETSACTGYRFLTEAEWEYAARSGTQSAFWTGDITEVACGLDPNLDPAGSYCGNSGALYQGAYEAGGQAGLEGPQWVREKAANAWGLYATGNVWEWASDVYAAYDHAPAQDPAGRAVPAADDARVARGGSWIDEARYARSAARLAYPAAGRSFNVGLRFGRTLPAFGPCTDADGDGAFVDTPSCRVEHPDASWDCQDADAAIHPGAAERCNGLDDDCDGPADEGVCTLCDGGAAVPCNACPAGTVVPAGWVCAPVGGFTMGSPEGETGRTPEETEHGVTLSRSFLIKATETTQGEWFAVMGSRPWYFEHCGEDCPLERVNWFEGAEFFNRLSVREGLEPCYDMRNCVGTPGDCVPGPAVCAGNFVCDALDARGVPACNGYRYPTEAEWEYSARAGTRTAFWSGPLTQIACALDPNLDVAGWYCGNSGVQYAGGYDVGGEPGLEGPHPVAGKAPNPWGLYDIHGNVWERTNDLHAPYEPGPLRDPAGPAAGDGYYIVRGGSFYDGTSQEARAAVRGRVTPEYRGIAYGFRPARSIIP